MGRSPCCHTRKLRIGPPRQEVLGFDLDTERMTISLPARKVLELRNLLEEWSAWRSTATVRELLVLAGKLHHAAYVIRPGRYFVRRLSAAEQDESEWAGEKGRGGCVKKG